MILGVLAERGPMHGHQIRRIAELRALGLVLHTGPRAFRLDESIAAMPICALWG